jgi:hypothetical protein
MGQLWRCARLETSGRPRSDVAANAQVLGNACESSQRHTPSRLRSSRHPACAELRMIAALPGDSFEGEEIDDAVWRHAGFRSCEAR